MDVQEVLSQARDAITVRRVFGDPHTQDGITLIPVATVAGGGGGGGGHDEEGSAGDGAGFGLKAHPAGAYVIKDGQVDWKPAVNVNRIILGGQVIGVVALLTAGAILALRQGAGGRCRRCGRRR